MFGEFNYSGICRVLSLSFMKGFKLTTYSQFEDNYSTIPLHPSDARLKANCRLWIDFVLPPSSPFHISIA